MSFTFSATLAKSTGIAATPPNSMAIVSVSQLAANLGALDLAPAQNGPRGMTIHPFTYQGQSLKLRLADDLNTVRVPFDPSTFNNSTTETRMTVAFSVPDSLFNLVAQIEERVRELLGSSAQSLWCSSVKPSDKYSATLRAKIHTQGPRQARFWNADGQQTTSPTVPWKTLPINAVVYFRGCYVTRQSIGLMLEVTDVQLGQPVTLTCPFF